MLIIDCAKGWNYGGLKGQNGCIEFEDETNSTKWDRWCVINQANVDNKEGPSWMYCDDVSGKKIKARLLTKSHIKYVKRQHHGNVFRVGRDVVICGSAGVEHVNQPIILAIATYENFGTKIGLRLLLSFTRIIQT